MNSKLEREDPLLFGGNFRDTFFPGATRPQPRLLTHSLKSSMRSVESIKEGGRGCRGDPESCAPSKVSPCAGIEQILPARTSFTQVSGSVSVRRISKNPPTSPSFAGRRICRRIRGFRPSHEVASLREARWIWTVFPCGSAAKESDQRGKARSDFDTESTQLENASPQYGGNVRSVRNRSKYPVESPTRNQSFGQEERSSRAVSFLMERVPRRAPRRVTSGGTRAAYNPTRFACEFPAEISSQVHRFVSHWSVPSWTPKSMIQVAFNCFPIGTTESRRTSGRSCRGEDSIERDRCEPQPATRRTERMARNLNLPPQGKRPRRRTVPVRQAHP